MPSYATQEEFDRYTGYYWRPTPSSPDHYQILYEEVDERAVPTTRLYSQEDTETWRFPFTGHANARSTLKIARINLNSEGVSANLEMV